MRADRQTNKQTYTQTYIQDDRSTSQPDGGEIRSGTHDWCNEEVKDTEECGVQSAYRMTDGVLVR